MSEVKKTKKKRVCPSCKQFPAEPSHTCPYRSDVYDDKDSKCKCCVECQNACVMDI